MRDDDIEIYADETRSQAVLTWYGLRQQTEKHTIDGVQCPSRCLADFIAPRSALEQAAQDGGRADAGRDYIGCFAVTAGINAQQQEAVFAAQNDDYSSIMFKALADRLAEAFAEYLHWRVRTDLWGYASAEALSNQQLIAEQYQGIRPAPGYPACPDHRVKKPLFELLQTSEIGMALTESYAMTPASSVSGFYFSHPQSCYFSVGKIDDAQVQDMAQRSAAPLPEVARALAPKLAL